MSERERETPPPSLSLSCLSPSAGPRGEAHVSGISCAAHEGKEEPNGNPRDEGCPPPGCCRPVQLPGIHGEGGEECHAVEFIV